MSNCKEGNLSWERDHRICELLNRRDPKGLELLFDEYYRPLVLWGNTFLGDLHLAEDIVQEFFIALWKQEIYRELKPETLGALLRVLVRNRCYNRLVKRDVLNHFVEIERIECMFEEYNDQHDRIMAKVMEEVALLPPRSREIMHRVFIKGMKYREVAEECNISVSTVKNLMASAFRRLRERLNKESFAEFLLVVFKYSYQTSTFFQKKD